jgi:hypothetical protein
LYHGESYQLHQSEAVVWVGWNAKMDWTTGHHHGGISSCVCIHLGLSRQHTPIIQNILANHAFLGQTHLPIDKNFLVPQLWYTSSLTNIIYKCSWSKNDSYVDLRRNSTKEPSHRPDKACPHTHLPPTAPALSHQQHHHSLIAH